MHNRRTSTSDSPRKNRDVTLRLYDMVTGDDDARLCRDIPEDQCREQPRNFLWQVAAQSFSKVGDALVDTKTVLPWLLGLVGAPPFFYGLLVPIRESVALLPQILVGSAIRRWPVRKGFWVVSSVMQGTCVILMGVVAVSGAGGVAAGLGIVALLVLFSLARGVASIAAKDTLGKTVSKRRRGRVSGYSATIAGIVAVGVGLFLVLDPGQSGSDWPVYLMLAAAGLCWFLGAWIYSTIKEFPGATEGGQGIREILRSQLLLLLKDPELQKFLLARALMISTALVAPLYVALAQQKSGQTLENLGWLIISTGLAGAMSSSVWGAVSDKSSRLTMVVAASCAGTLGVLVLVVMRIAPNLTESIAFYAVVFFILGVAHAGIRIGRKTHIVDMASGDRRAEYVALSNTLIGAILLGLGALTGVFIGIGLEFAIAVLSVMSLLGAIAGFTLRDVQAQSESDG